MNSATSVLQEYTDFECFSRTGSDVGSFICEIHCTEWTFRDDVWIFEISANRFLRNMVRAIVGTLMDIGRGHTTIHDLRRIIESKDRSQAGASAPAHGLYLWDIQYPGGIWSIEY